MALATSSFPVPVSPRMRTVESVGATVSTPLSSAASPALCPMMTSAKLAGLRGMSVAPLSGDDQRDLPSPLSVGSYPAESSCTTDSLQFSRSVWEATQRLSSSRVKLSRAVLKSDADTSSFTRRYYACLMRLQERLYCNGQLLTRASPTFVVML